MARKDVVIRISEETQARLKALMATTEKPKVKIGSKGRPLKPKEPSVEECLALLLDSQEKLQEGRIQYIVAGRAFTDVSEARGEAIMQAVKFQQVPMWPRIVVEIGIDEGA